MKKIIPFLLLLAAPSIRAADAHLINVKGPVTVKPAGGASYDARHGDPVYNYDEIKTGPDAAAHLSFKDGTAVLMKSDSDLTIVKKGNDVVLNVAFGELLVGLKYKPSADQKFRVKTPAAAASLQGTSLWVFIDSSTKNAEFSSLEGPVEVLAQGKKALWEPGQRGKIPFGQAPEAPSPADFPAGFLDGFKINGSLEGVAVAMPAAPAPGSADKPVSNPVPAAGGPASPLASSTAPATAP